MEGSVRQVRLATNYVGGNLGQFKFRVRYKEPNGKVRSKLVVSNSHKRASKVGKGRVLEVCKVSQNYLDGVGEYNTMPERLMKEFELEKKKNGLQSNKEVVCNVR